MKITTIALNTFKEAKRDRVLYLLFFFVAVCLLFSRFLALLTVGDRVKIIKDVGLASISLFGMLMAILMGTGLVYKEIDKKTIFTLLAKPIHRAEFLLGKFLGLVLTIFIMTVLMAAVFMLILFLHTFSVDWKILLAILYIFFELCLMTAVALLFSTFTTPILASLYSLAFYLIGHLSWSLEMLIKKVKSGAGRAALRVLYTVLPDLENFNFKTEVVHNLPLPGKLLGTSFVYGVVYTAFLLLLAMLVFRRRDFV
ncbi:MAG: ABC transporter permease [Candidatus Saccharicenans sp.]|jgi:ABC-type transport system involved in multi-copper enzyme maturation permease subunit|nr:ABC transporter permease [Candidatus Saccharicenans sp.]MDH7574603.1 ABC transporter permease [Candidatus Saccharicenans sp.]